MRLKGKTAWVTGAASGIGAKIAERFAAEGADVAVNDVAIDGAERTAETLRALGRKAIVVPGDVTNEADMKSAADAAIAAFGHLDILVNNAGINPPSPFRDMTYEQFDRMFKVHAYGLFNCAHAVVGHMCDRKAGRIIVISSMSALKGDINMVHYSAAKAAQIGFVSALSREVCPMGVTVNSIAPGLTQTPMIVGLSQESLERYAPPVGRLGKPEDHAAAAVFLASDEASFITGQTLQVAGGIS
jgi:3-oxoacyl-[acyl-carrier protein] reductase